MFLIEKDKEASDGSLIWNSSTFKKIDLPGSGHGSEDDLFEFIFVNACSLIWGTRQEWKCVCIVMAELAVKLSWRQLSRILQL